MVRKWTVSILIVVVTLLILWDVYAVTVGGVEATISRVIYFAATAHPIIAFAGGVLCGHLFWPQGGLPKD